MTAINMDQNEVLVLHDVVQISLSELHTEISHTDERDFRNALKSREKILQAILQKLDSVVKQPT